MWVLIITLVSANGGVGILSMEFVSEKACLAAGEKWKDDTDSFGRSAHFTCASNGEKQ